MGKAERHRGRRRKKSVGDDDGGGTAFRPGMEVEVRSDEDGFRGAWYEATIVRRLPQRGRFEVSYASLVDDHDPSLPLHETVRRSNIRPRPPLIQPAPNAAGRYGLHDLVEAFHNDGWWAGVITAGPWLHALARYLISFPTSREEEVFEASQVRPQLNWTRGLWVPVDGQGAEYGKAMFAAGAHVEVSRESDKCGVAWFSATVMKVLSKTTYLVEYENLKASNDRELLVEIVDVQYLRPHCSNALSEKGFVVDDEVEMLHHDGWAPAKILKILDDSQYIVRTTHDEKEIQLGHNELRHRHFWNGEGWILHCHMKTKNNGVKFSGRKRNSQVGKICSLPISVSTSSDDGEVACDSSSIKLSCKYKKAKGQHEFSQVIEQTKKVKLLESFKAPLLFEGLGTPKENGSSVEQHQPGNLSIDEQNDASNVNSFPKLTKNDGGLQDIHDKGSDQQLEVSGAPPIDHENNDFLPISKWWNRTTRGYCIKSTKRTKLVTRDPKRQKKAATDDGLSQQPQESERTERSSSGKGEPDNSNETAQEVDETCCIRDKDDSLGCLHQGNSPQLCQQNDVLMLQGTPSILDLMSEPNNANETAQEVNASSCCRDKDDSSGCLHRGNSSQLCQENDVLMLRRTTLTLDIMSEHNNSNETTQEVTKIIRNRDKDDLSSCMHRENTTIKCLATQTLLEDMFKTPTSGGILNSMGVYTDDQAVPMEMVAEKECTESNQTMAPSETVIFEDKGAPDPSPRGSSSEATSLPFVKISSLWKSIESMEVFQVMPQHPHFLPLEQYSMVFREGMAIGLMISFANLVASIRQIRIDDAEASVNEKLRALGPFEAHGFHVRLLRSRLQKLLKIQSLQKQYETRKASMEAKILEKRDDKERLNYFITALDEARVKLEENLSIFHEKKDAMMTEKSSNDAEISKLEVDMHEAEEIYDSIRESFDATLSAPW